MTNTEKGIDLLQLIVKGQAQEAFDTYTHHDLIHHNAYFDSKPSTLIKAMNDEAKANPAKIFEVLRTVEQDDHVVVHTRVRQQESDLGYAIVHIFRFEGQLIKEMWDIGQVVPQNQINENGMF